jgi:hypothetical protein
MNERAQFTEYLIRSASLETNEEILTWLLNEIGRYQKLTTTPRASALCTNQDNTCEPDHCRCQ